jgi:hypothetical protein
MMSKPVQPLVCFLAWILLVDASLVQAQDKAKPPAWVHGLVFRVRKAGELDFGDMTKRFGLEVFKDENTNLLVYVTETGAIAQAPAVAVPPDAKTKPPTWLHGLEFRVRRAGEADFTKDTKKFGVEVFKDENTGYLVYASETGDITQALTVNTAPEARTKTPTWMHGIEFKVRKGGENDFTKDTKKYGVEVFKDENTGYFIYISETGSIAQAPAAPKPADGKTKAPTWMHGLEFRVRRAGEADFTKDTKKYGVEVFKDENTGHLVYICETGAIAVVPGKGAPADGKSAKSPEWLHGLEFRVRKSGEDEFGKDTKKWGLEVFRDENNGNLVYISETGSLTIVPAK